MSFQILEIWGASFYFMCNVRIILSNLVFGNRKYEEIKPPDVEDFCYITDNTYSKEEVILVFHLLLMLMHGLDLDFADFCNLFFFFGNEGCEHGG